MKKEQKKAELTAEEKKELQVCEKTIKACITKPFDMGRALRTIRNKQLFLTTHSTFADYAEAKWQLNKSGAYAKIKAADVADLVLELGLVPLTNEAQALALSKLDKDKIKEVWMAATSHKTRQPTAALIKELGTEKKEVNPWYVRRLEALQKEVANFRKKLSEDMPQISLAQVNLFGSIMDDVQALKAELASLAVRTDEAGQDSDEE